MATTINKHLINLLFIILVTGCRTATEIITICDNRYDVYKHTEYNYEQNLNATFNVLCFHNSKIIAFAYQSAGVRNDSNLIFTTLTHRNDSLIESTHYNKAVFGYSHQSDRYFKCIENGFILSGVDTVLITKKTARKKNNKLKW